VMLLAVLQLGGDFNHITLPHEAPKQSMHAIQQVVLMLDALIF